MRFLNFFVTLWDYSFFQICRLTCTAGAMYPRQSCSRSTKDQQRPTWTGTPPATAQSGWCASSSRFCLADRIHQGLERSDGYNRVVRLHSGHICTKDVFFSLVFILFQADLVAKGNGSLLELSRWRLRGLIRQEGEKTQKLGQEAGQQEHRGEPLHFILQVRGRHGQWANRAVKLIAFHQQQSSSRMCLVEASTEKVTVVSQVMLVFQMMIDQFQQPIG